MRHKDISRRVEEGKENEGMKTDSHTQTHTQQCVCTLPPSLPPPSSTPPPPLSLSRAETTYHISIKASVLPACISTPLRESLCHRLLPRSRVGLGEFHSARHDQRSTASQTSTHMTDQQRHFCVCVCVHFFFLVHECVFVCVCCMYVGGCVCVRACMQIGRAHV